jgi:gluconokinase
VLASETLGALAETVAARGPARVVAVALSTAMHGLIGLDAGHRPLTPLLTLADSRATAEAAELRAAGAASALHRGSGTPVHPMSPLVKLTWFRRHEPALAERGAHLGGAEGLDPAGADRNPGHRAVQRLAELYREDHGT